MRLLRSLAAAEEARGPPLGAAAREERCKTAARRMAQQRRLRRHASLPLLLRCRLLLRLRPLLRRRCRASPPRERAGAPAQAVPRVMPCCPCPLVACCPRLLHRRRRHRYCCRHRHPHRRHQRWHWPPRRGQRQQRGRRQRGSAARPTATRSGDAARARGRSASHAGPATDIGIERLAVSCRAAVAAAHVRAVGFIP